MESCTRSQTFAAGRCCSLPGLRGEAAVLTCRAGRYFTRNSKGKNFEIISVAQDTGGAKDAGPWITAAKPEFTALVDEQQIVTQKYNMVNVPTAVWIDERGRIVRPNEVAFVDDRFKSFTGMDSAPYVDAIRD